MAMLTFQSPVRSVPIANGFLCRSVALSFGRTRNRVAYDRQLVNFEALECVQTRRQRREVDGAHTEPPDGTSGALAAEVATERYLSKTPAAKQTREAVRGIRALLLEYLYKCRALVVELYVQDKGCPRLSRTAY